MIILLILIARAGDMEGRSEAIAPIARWLAEGSTMMSEMWDKDTIDIKRMLHTETKRLRPFIADHQTRTDRIDKKVSDHLKGIIGSAIELDQMMMCSKAIFQIHWRDRSQKPGHLERWNPEAMEAVAWEHEPSPKRRVRFYASPILYKAGTADGQRYDSSMVLAKGTVICD
jgi:hypothetical protein